jgi:hypothetical protein
VSAEEETVSRPPTRTQSGRVNAAALVLALALAWAPGREAAAQDLPTTTAPDLRLEWIIGDGDKDHPQNATAPAPIAPIEGRAGETVRLKYRIRNVGSTDAFAVVVRVQTGLGTTARPIRIQPGPSAGSAIERTVDVALAVGLAEVCVGASLQTIRLDDPRDPFTEDNRICRRATVRPSRTRKP